MRVYNFFLICYTVIAYPFLDTSTIKNTNIQNIPKLFKNIEIYNDISTNIQVKDTRPIILNGPKTPLKKDFLELLFKSTYTPFFSFSFNNFVLQKPYLFNYNSAIFIEDFLINDGRIFNEEENDVIINMKNSPNYIILNADNIETIPYQDFRINRKFKVLNFPLIHKKEYVHHIHDIIIFNEYTDDMFCIDWEDYDIHLLSLENINCLLKDVEYLLKSKLEYNIHNFDKIRTTIKNLIKYYLDDKKYNIEEFFKY